jgi:hypothetical protein
MQIQNGKIAHKIGTGNHILKKMDALNGLEARNRFLEIHSASLYSLAESIFGLLKRLQIRALELG